MNTLIKKRNWFEMLVLKVAGIPDKFVAYYLQKNKIPLARLRRKRLRGGGFNLVGQISKEIGLFNIIVLCAKMI